MTKLRQAYYQDIACDSSVRFVQLSHENKILDDNWVINLRSPKKRGIMGWLQNKIDIAVNEKAKDNLSYVNTRLKRAEEKIDVLEQLIAKEYVFIHITGSTVIDDKWFNSKDARQYARDHGYYYQKMYTEFGELWIKEPKEGSHESNV